MSEMVERAARAIYEAACKTKGVNGSEYQLSGALADDGKTLLPLTSLDGDYDLAELAKAVIESLREPTAAMSFAGEIVDVHVDFDEEGRCVGSAASEVWRAMIDAALCEDGK